MSKSKIIYSRGFPYGAPMVVVRGGGTKRDEVKRHLKDQGFHWDGRLHGWMHYMYGEEFREVLEFLRDTFGCEIKPKDNLDPQYVIDLTEVEA